MRLFAFSLAATALLASSLAIAAPAPRSNPLLGRVAAEVREAQLRRTVERLVGFGTRHTLSSQTDPRRGIGASVRWAEAELKAHGLVTLQTCDIVTGRRVPTPTRVCNAVAIQRGTTRPNDVVIITGHIDSRVTDVMDFTKDSPGANDDASGTAAVLEAARVLSRRKFAGTIVYGVLSGEEQGLLGGKILADYAKAQGWNVVANLNNDIIGNACGSDKTCDPNTVRVFSEGPRWQGREDLAAQQRSLGGENDSPSRNLSRFLDTLAERHPEIGLDVRQIWRNDRFGRGGDHTEFLNAGYPAIRFSVAVENYDHQHQDLRTENGVEYGDTADKLDFSYLTKVTRLNVAALAALASAPPPPEEPEVTGAVQTFTNVSWRKGQAAGANWIIRWRRTDANQWQQSNAAIAPACQEGPAEGSECRYRLPGVRVDDWIFGVSSISKDGFESPVASAVPGGAFKPYVAPPPAPPTR